MILDNMPVIKTSLTKNDLQERKLSKAEVDGKSIVTTKIGDNFYPMDSIYSHEGGPLEEGTLEN